MRVLLVGAGLEENLSLAYLASALRAAGHRADLAAFDVAGEIREVVRAARESSPDLIGCSVAFQHRVRDFRALARALREAGIEALLVWGGQIPTARAAGVLAEVPEVDVVVRHDGERTLVELLEAVASSGPLPRALPGTVRPLPDSWLVRLSRVDGLAFRLADGRPGMTPPRAVEADLDSLEPPVRDRPPARHAGLPFAPLVGSRGCWQSCTYCSIQTYHRGRGGPRVRLRGIEPVADEMADLYHRRQVRIFCFHDENLFLPSPVATIRRLDRLRQALDRRGVGRIGVVAKCRPDQATAEVLQAARRLGVMRVYIGIENGCQNGLDHLGRDTDVATCERSLRLLRQAGIYACFNILLFEPDTTLQDVAENLAFLEGVPDTPWNFCRAEVYPGTPLEERLRARGRLRGGLDGTTYDLEDPAADRLFRVTAIAFGGRNFGPQSTANQASGVGYLAALLDHFHPGRESTTFLREARGLIGRLNRDTRERLQEALAFVAAGPAADALVRFTEDLALRVAAADATIGAAMEDLQARMEAFGRARADQVLRPAQVRPWARAAAVLAVTGIAGQGCPSSGVMDPLPQDLPTADEVMVVDPVPTDVFEDVPPVDPPPPDVREDLPPVDPPPPDSWQDLPPVDPPPPDVQEDLPPVDPPPPDVQEVQDPDYPVVDPPPPDAVEDAEDPGTPSELPPVDPPPPEPESAPRRSVQPLDRSFRVTLVATEGAAGALELEARAVGAEGVAWRWTALGGALDVQGDRARFTADGSHPPVVVVVARGPGHRLDVARWIVASRRT
ncbi:MAG TPA: cobalamin-dependent protein [Myxococcota bacterium]|nr:cobalamin-dependent protein [Myxococcota bacterium]HQK51314.1 cobalamin-dependent protein [Myxococcota bacterium]